MIAIIIGAITTIVVLSVISYLLYNKFDKIDSSMLSMRVGDSKIFQEMGKTDAELLQKNSDLLTSLNNTTSYVKTEDTAINTAIGIVKSEYTTNQNRFDTLTNTVTATKTYTDAKLGRFNTNFMGLSNIVQTNRTYTNAEFGRFNTNFVGLSNLVKTNRTYTDAEFGRFNTKLAGWSNAFNTSLTGLSNTFNTNFTELSNIVQTNKTYTDTEFTNYRTNFNTEILTANNVNINDSISAASNITTRGGNITISNGMMGVGTLTPSAKLHVIGGTLFTGGSSSFEHDILAKQNTQLSLDGTGIGSRFIVKNQTAGGYVGIGTSIPAAKLHVVGNGIFNGTGTFGSISSTGAVKGGSLCIGNTCVNESKLQKLNALP